jgi:hypothetical protein
MKSLDKNLINKIKRRAGRAWDHKKKIHRITEVTDTELKYRIPEPGNYYGTQNIVVTRTPKGRIKVPKVYGKSLFDLQIKGDLSKIKGHDDATIVEAYKLTRANGQGPQYGGITYEVGKTYEEKNANTSPSTDCGAGINVASFDWVKREYKDSYRIFKVRFTMKDLAAIPTNSDGKLRVFKCDVIEELDLVKLGLKKPDPKPLPGPKADIGGLGDPPAVPKSKPKDDPAPIVPSKIKTGSPCDVEVEEPDPVDKTFDFSKGKRGPIRPKAEDKPSGFMDKLKKFFGG